MELQMLFILYLLMFFVFIGLLFILTLKALLKRNVFENELDKELAEITLQRYWDLNTVNQISFLMVQGARLLSLIIFMRFREKD